MNTESTWQIISVSSDATEKLGETLGARLHGGEVIELISDLGGGKTTFVRGLARGMGSTDNVASPTFTISREYKAGTHTLHHFDFYRLVEPGIVVDELAEVMGDPNDIVVVEWGGIVENVLPKNKITITLQATGENTRQITLSYPKEMGYIIPAEK